MSPDDPEKSTIVVLTPGPFNSAYFEHSFLARSMGIELVEASDLFVDGDEVFVRTTLGPRRVHVIYRRTDDAYLDPEFFRPDSMLGRARADARVARRQGRRWPTRPATASPTTRRSTRSSPT